MIRITVERDWSVDWTKLATRIGAGAAIVFALALTAFPIWAQTLSAPAGSVDLSSYAKIADVPQPSNAVPPQPVMGGQTGTAGTYVPAGAAPRLIVQSANTTTDASGSWSVTFNQAFQSATPTVNALPVVAPTATQPSSCNVTSRSTTTITGKCFASQTVLLNLGIITTGINLNPFATAPAGMAVMVWARDSSQ